jgi:hypothetical protein
MAGKGKISGALSAYRDARILELLGQGYSRQAIADDLAIDRSTVGRRIAAIGKAAAKKRDGLQEELLATHLETYEYIISEALTAWRKSKQPLRRVSRLQLALDKALNGPAEQDDSGDDGERATAKVTVKTLPRENITTTVEERAGNPSYLEAALAALARRESLAGLNAVIKVAPTTPDGARPYQSLPDQELQKRALALVMSELGALIPKDLLDAMQGAIIDVTPSGALPAPAAEEEDEP